MWYTHTHMHIYNEIIYIYIYIYMKSPWCWERLRAEGEEGIRGWDGWMAPLTQWYEFEQTPGDGERQGSMHATIHGVTKSQTQLSD